ncbi:glycine betaine ABC transporter substrate-binding protein [Actinomycetospora sp. NBRC 106378]|jgi:osmoprotectant transport system substrate-binding protein|uniref:glycine betaine ABC transporter substrate-binding protein n=1 Tax=Actinomycetospora sp. NBRC 106378 TaxID=3032208 RepID=UPI0024A2E52B|nr:glycine betaine ABC transporter substrate-binding protein [Actinomycetospora sp. NBRC 106378]GLZ56151.1 glycine/betaine ABC transporter substrate-binding protein [Actinomycetospora sp. NBRC 106378]
MRRRLLAAVVALLAATVLSGCGGDAPRATPPGSFARDVDLTGQTFVVGSKEFDEQLLLCRMTIALLQSAGASVVERCDTKGSENVRSALTAGSIDMYWEYTGTAWRTYLRQEAQLTDPQELYEAVQVADAANGVRWLRPAPFDNTYAIGVTAANADRLGVRSISDLARLVRGGSPDATLCIDQEFTGREDGLVGLLRAYDFQFPDGALDTLDVDDIYPALAASRPCVFGEVFATDGRLNALRINTLDDDRGYFLPYQAALTVRSDVLTRAPRLALIGERLAPMLTDQVMRELNARVSVGRRSPDDVARTFLREQGLIG